MSESLERPWWHLSVKRIAVPVRKEGFFRRFVGGRTGIQWDFPPSFTNASSGDPAVERQAALDFPAVLSAKKRAAPVWCRSGNGRRSGAARGRNHPWSLSLECLRCALAIRFGRHQSSLNCSPGHWGNYVVASSASSRSAGRSSRDRKWAMNSSAWLRPSSSQCGIPKFFTEYWSASSSLQPTWSSAFPSTVM